MTFSQNLVFNVVDVQARFLNGDLNSFKRYIDSVLVIPENSDCIKLRCIVKFSVNDKGNIADIEFVDSVESYVKRAIVSVLRTSNGKWEPALIYNKPVKQNFVIPIRLRNKNQYCESFEYLVKSADSLLLTKDVKDAIFYYKEALKKKPDIEVYYKLIDIYVNNNQAGNCCPVINEALKQVDFSNDPKLIETKKKYCSK